MILPEDYYRRYGENLSTTGNPKEAWWQTEKDFSRTYSDEERGIILHRFKDYESFCSAFRRYNSTGMPGHIEIKIVLIGDVKIK